MIGSLGDVDVLLADRAYDSNALRRAAAAADQGAWANIKPMSTRRDIPASNGFLYRYRNLVERFRTRFNESMG